MPDSTSSTRPRLTRPSPPLRASVRATTFDRATVVRAEYTDRVADAERRAAFWSALRAVLAGMMR